MKRDGKRLISDTRGFTLLELLVSFVMIAIIAAIAAAALRLGIRSVDTGEKKIDSLERIRTSLSIVDSQVQSQTPVSYDDNGEKKYYFQGEADAMQFSTTYSIWGGQKGYVLVKYKVDSDSTGKKTLTASENVIGLESTRETQLFTSADAISFEYFYKDPTEEIGSWVEKWTEELTIPEKIRMTLTYGKTNVSLIMPVWAWATMNTATTITTLPGGR